MSEPKIRIVLVAGAGSIGIGVAKSFAAAGFTTQVLSRNPARLEGQLDGAQLMDELPLQAPDLIVESLPEFPDLKMRFYAQVEDAYQGASILATNTSGLPLPELACSLRYPGQFLGMHYLYPAHLPGLFVEVIRTLDTSAVVVEKVIWALKQCEKTPIMLNRPVVGGLFNRLQHAILREAYYLIDQEITTPEQIDDIAKWFIAPRMCITGLLKQKDISGLDTHALAQRSIVPHLCHDRTPSRILETHYEQGHFGLKTGTGFYDWSGADPERVRFTTNEKVARIRALMRKMESDDET